MVTAARTVSQVGMHMGVAFAVMYAFTGSLALGGVAAVVEPICNVALLPLHDKLWERIRARVAARQEVRAATQGDASLSSSTMQA
ncbi:DUF2061 domain-containing protein [Oxalicibacterium faecigallinarum]|uniref:DUF2061 domain-containing protein n=1 Tax=Oxalicibacterium faecigallinarum TaxID=573741 RepID=A0A8J3F1F1_9BURK|nr:DUF2061 domain-containing protein [Oxalicibacterium faecigallinarum]GGI19202.1 hypothetical protein GCM10008066_17900 [Oxalicibacterium faecigallinarum]